VAGKPYGRIAISGKPISRRFSVRSDSFIGGGAIVSGSRTHVSPLPLIEARLYDTSPFSPSSANS
jgi:hypothetical protein